MEQSAGAYQSKKASLSQECVRRLLNTDDDRPQAEVDQVINDFQSKLKGSGYNQLQQKEIIEGGLLGYKRRVARQGGVKHRDVRDTEKEREKKRLTGKSNWFKESGKKAENQSERELGERGKKRKRDSKDTPDNVKRKPNTKREDPITVLFVPRTTRGELARLIKAKEEEIGKITSHRIRIVERNGERLEHMLVKADPFGEEKCEERNCLMCKTDEKDQGRCKKKNLVYKIECRLCQTEGKTGVYWGETARTAQLRGGDTTMTLQI